MVSHIAYFPVLRWNDQSKLGRVVRYIHNSYRKVPLCLGLGIEGVESAVPDGLHSASEPIGLLAEAPWELPSCSKWMTLTPTLSPTLTSKRRKALKLKPLGFRITLEKRRSDLEQNTKMLTRM